MIILGHHCVAILLALMLIWAPFSQSMCTFSFCINLCQFSNASPENSNDPETIYSSKYYDIDKIYINICFQYTLIYIDEKYKYI